MVTQTEVRDVCTSEEMTELKKKLNEVNLVPSDRCLTLYKRTKSREIIRVKEGKKRQRMITVIIVT